MDLAPNGLPFSRSPTAQNEWTERSSLLAQLPADIVGTVHPCIVARPRSDVGGGMGLFASFGLRKGEAVWAERSRAGPDVTAVPRTRAWIDALPPASKKAYCHFMYKTGDDEYQSLAEFNDVPIEDFPTVRTIDVSNYMNHSCDPTCWFVDGGEDYTGVMVATRDILPGEEITYDYCTSEDCDLTPDFEVHGQSANCRGRVSHNDWELPELQQRYRGHFLPHIAERIAKATGEAVVPLEKVGRAGTWWLRLNEGSALGPCQQPGAASLLEVDRKNYLQNVATGAALDLLNRQASILISHLRIRMRDSEEVGRYLECGEAAAQGELVMLLPPNLLLWEEEVEDFNTCLQLGTTAAGARLFSSSLTENDLDNFLCHSCDPNCDVVIGKDLTAGLVANRPIPAGASITFDYDTTEDDLRGDRAGFECQCGSYNCRKVVLGKLYSPKAGAREEELAELRKMLEPGYSAPL